MAVETITDHRGEVRVETGTGLVTKVEHDDGKRNAHVEIKATHSDKMRFPLQAWVDTQSPTFGHVKWAHANNAEISYRIEVHRRRNVDVSVPLDQLDKTDRVKDLVSIAKKGTDAPASVPPSDAQPPSGTDHPGQGSGPADRRDTPDQAAPQPHNSEAAYAALEGFDKRLRNGRPLPAHAELDYWARQCANAGATKAQFDQVVDAFRRGTPATVEESADRAMERHRASPDGALPDDPWANDAANPRPTSIDAPPPADMVAETADAARDPDRIAGRAPAPGDHPDGHDPASPPPARPISQTSGLSRQRHPIASDSKPWDQYNSDGRINYASYEASAVTEMASLASRLIVTRIRDRAAEDPRLASAAPSTAQIKGLADNLLRMADAVQSQLRSDGEMRGRVDRMSSSHKLARNAVREGLDLYPVPWGVSADEREAWMRDVVAYAVALLDVVVGILEPHALDDREKSA